MATYNWPGWCVNRFEMRVLYNTRVFTGPYTPSAQVLDLLGERWLVSFDTTPGVNQEAAGQLARLLLRRSRHHAGRLRP